MLKLIRTALVVVSLAQLAACDTQNAGVGNQAQGVKANAANAKDADKLYGHWKYTTATMIPKQGHEIVSTIAGDLVLQKDGKRFFNSRQIGSIWGGGNGTFQAKGDLLILNDDRGADGEDINYHWEIGTGVEGGEQIDKLVIWFVTDEGTANETRVSYVLHKLKNPADGGV